MRLSTVALIAAVAAAPPPTLAPEPGMARWLVDTGG